MKQLLKFAVLFWVGGAFYVAIEILWRNYTDRSMLVLGGLCFVLVGSINNRVDWDMRLEFQLLLGVFLVTIAEFFAGCILNIWLGLNIWDYSHMRFNLYGQICLDYTFLWVPLVLAAILLDDQLRYRLYGERKPYYRVGKTQILGL